MNERYVRRLAALGTTVMLFGLLLPTFFGAARHTDGTGGDAWRNVIQDFQTLFAGILAVGAAYATIWQMQKSDARSDQRQGQLVKLSLRADGLEVERALYPAFQLLRTDCDTIRNYDRLRALLPSPVDDPPSDKLLLALGTIATTADDIAIRLDVFGLPNTAKLLDGQLTNQILTLKSAAMVLQSSAMHADKAVRNELAFTEQYVEDQSPIITDLLHGSITTRVEFVEVVVNLMEDVEVSSTHVFAGLSKLALLYDLKIPID